MLYTTSGTWITSVPKDAEVLASVSEDDDFYISSWWLGNEKVKKQDLAITKDLENTTITLFANDAAFRALTKHSYRLLANSIFNAKLEKENNDPFVFLDNSNRYFLVALGLGTSLIWGKDGHYF